MAVRNPLCLLTSDAVLRTGRVRSIGAHRHRQHRLASRDMAPVIPQCVVWPLWCRASGVVRAFESAVSDFWQAGNHWLSRLTTPRVCSFKGLMIQQGDVPMSVNPRSHAKNSLGAMTRLNTGGHKAALGLFLVIVLAHWAEHLAQAVQIYIYGWPTPEARGVLGIPFPWLVTSEWMHYGYALIMLVGFVLLRPGFSGRSRTWWNVTLGIQVWHHFEHLLLLVQALTGSYLLGKAVPTSVVQLVFPRVELHLFYNALVTLPMVVAMVLHRRPATAGQEAAGCTCAVPRMAAQPA